MINGSSILGTSASISLNWTNGGSLFLVWLDDNSGDGTDSANQYDNFSLRVTAGTPTNFFCLVSAPSHGATLLSGTSVTAAALTANATAPYTVEYFTNSGAGNTIFASAGTSGTAPYNVSLGNLPVGTYRIYAVSTDSAGAPLSTNSVTNTFSVADPIAFTLTAPSDGSTFAHTNPVLGTATIAGGTAPYSVQFYFDNLPSGAAVTFASLRAQLRRTPRRRSHDPSDRDGREGLGEQFVGPHSSHHGTAGGEPDSGEWFSISLSALPCRSPRLWPAEKRPTRRSFTSMGKWPARSVHRRSR